MGRRKRGSGVIRRKFFLDKQCLGFSPYEEVFEYEEDTTEEEIQEDFTNWVFDQLDSAILDVEESEVAE